MSADVTMAGGLNPDYEQVKNLLSNTVTLLCKNSVKFSQKLHVEALVGVTVDQNDVFFVHISETIPKESHKKTADMSKTCSDSSHLAQKPLPTSKLPCQPQLCSTTEDLPGSSSIGHSSHIGPTPPQTFPSPVSDGQPQQTPHHHQQPCYNELRETSSERNANLEATMGDRLRHHESDDFLQQDQLRPPDTVARKASMVAGQRRAPPVVKVKTEPGLSPVAPAGPGNNEATTGLTSDEMPVANLDDAQAMQQGYSLTSGHDSFSRVGTNSHGPFEEPFAKRRCIEPSVGATPSGYAVDGSTFGGTHWPSDDSGSGHGPMGSPEAMSRPPQQQAFPGCSSWSQSTHLQQGQLSTDLKTTSPPTTRGFKNPRNNTMCQPVRDVLEFNLARPVLSDAEEVTAFRLFWRGQDTIAGWENIIYNRLELDAIVAEHAGVSFFISAITGTARDPKTIPRGQKDARARAYPALGYWVVSRQKGFDRHTLMKKLSSASEGGELKTMLHSDGEKVNEVGALNLIVKDYGKGYVQQRVAESAQHCCGPGEEHPTIRFILKEDFFEAKLREAVDFLSGVGCPVSLEKVELDALTAEREEEVGNEDQENLPS